MLTVAVAVVEGQAGHAAMENVAFTVKSAACVSLTLMYSFGIKDGTRGNDRSPVNPAGNAFPAPAA